MESANSENVIVIQVSKEINAKLKKVVLKIVTIKEYVL
jgi:hypothetical protein